MFVFVFAHQLGLYTGPTHLFLLLVVKHFTDDSIGIRQTVEIVLLCHLLSKSIARIPMHFQKIYRTLMLLSQREIQKTKLSRTSKITYLFISRGGILKYSSRLFDNEKHMTDILKFTRGRRQVV